MKQTKHFDIVVVGNGPVGKIAALSFAKSGFEVALVAPANARLDHRTTALMVPSINYLKDLGVWELLSSQTAPLRSMRIVDGTNHLIRARTVTFHATEIGEQAFGWNMPNSALSAALDQLISATKSILPFNSSVTSYSLSSDNVSASLEDGTELTTQLIAAADGRNSLARTVADIKVKAWTYPQTAFVTTFEHRLSHEDMSTEFHTSYGPCVQVPLPGNRSSLVWVVAPLKAKELLALDAAQLSMEIEKQLFSILGKVAVGPERQSFPLSGQYPEQFAKNRIALLGEAAHVFPPIGAQGLNLGIRDVEDLTAVTNANPSDPGAASVLENYNRNRRPDILARVGAVDALNRSLLSSLLPAQVARAFGLALLDSAPPLRSLFMREGMRPGTGISSLIASFKKQASEKRT
jgi:2-octaprenyl-6-methoxyphenol hydroxylase